jgi:hypothetical protein
VNASRLPDFLIVGAMKAGTTSLFDWLGVQPEVFVPPVKEPNFFSDEGAWRRGIDRYGSLFRDAAPDQHVGEASVAYTDPSRAAIAASRIASAIPDVRVVFVARDPVERTRSHYRHEVLRGREKRPMGEAAASMTSTYVQRSLYYRCLEPYLERFSRGRIRIVTFESLFGADERCWSEVVSFLGLDPRPRPTAHRNASTEREQFRPAMRMLWDAGVRRVPGAVPSFVRRAARPLLLRPRPDPLLRTAGDPLPAEIVRGFEEDAERLRRWAGAQESFWQLAAEVG